MVHEIQVTADFSVEVSIAFEYNEVDPGVLNVNNNYGNQKVSLIH